MSVLTGLFHPLVEQWFNSKFKNITDIQKKAWPVIASGEHLLVTAPTGSGKTLTAFLWAVNQLATGGLPTRVTSVLYVSPLKALNNDIRRNLTGPIKEIGETFESKGHGFPEIRVLTRSGDTPQNDRRRMIRHPPEILITTPESLNLMLSSVSGRGILQNLSLVIMDEIHAVIDNKRGTHLMTAVERLVRLSGEFQRLALSATVKELDAVADFAAGYEMQGSMTMPDYIPRAMATLTSNISKSYCIRVKYPKKAAETGHDDSVWDLLATEILERIRINRSTLVFTNGRRLCEKLTFKINKLAREPLAYSHHGSLSKLLRSDVEKKLKNGELKAIIATSSLEMGIDIGDLDEVVLVQSPPSVSSAVQRVGRAGHQVDAQSCGTIFPPHPQDLIYSAVLAKAIDTQDIEPLLPVRCPLDVLAQILISMTGVETWDIDELFANVRAAWPFHHLSRDRFDLVLNMLAGRYADTRIRELKPRVSIDRLDNTVAARKGALLALYMSGGTIPDRGYFKLRHDETNARIGELDEEYVWEAKIGQIATMGTQNWRIKKITHSDVFAVPVGNRYVDAPFWIAEGINRDGHFSDKVARFLEEMDTTIKDPSCEKILQSTCYMDENAARELTRFLKSQTERTQSSLPHRHHMLLEYVRSGPDGGPGTMLVLHTLWGGRINRPYSLAMETAWKERFNEKPEIFPGNDAIVVQLPGNIPPEEVLSLVSSASVENQLRTGLETSGFFSARFRECAGRSLLVTKNKINQRMPLWMTRLRSQKLMEAVLGYPDFPILLEAWRTCLQDEFDLERLKNNLAMLESGTISWSQAFTSRPSPFAAAMAWNQINQYMYHEDQPASAVSSLGSDLIRDIVFSPNMRPTVPSHIVEGFVEKRQRLTRGYAPGSARDLTDWVKERTAIAEPEWKTLLKAVKKDHQNTFDTILEGVEDKLVRVYPPGARQDIQHFFVTALEDVRFLACSWYEDSSQPAIYGIFNKTDIPGFKTTGNDRDMVEETGYRLLGQWLQYYGPVSVEFIQQRLGLDIQRLAGFLDDLNQEKSIITGQLITDGSKEDVCDARNFEILLRLARTDAVPRFKALALDRLPLFLARHMRLTTPGSNAEDLFVRLEQLCGMPLPADAWETDILPARIQPYHAAFLDAILQEGDMTWLGVGKQKTTFCFHSDLDLLAPAISKNDKKDPNVGGFLNQAFDTPAEHHDFLSLMDKTGMSGKALSKILWQAVWEGRLSNQMFAALRKGIETGYKPLDTVPKKKARRFSRRRRLPRAGFSRWKGSLPFTGQWFRQEFENNSPEGSNDLMEKEELSKERTRMLFDRYGILFRELLTKELPGFRWADVFRSLRMMELSGEILSGFFFKGIPGPQFISKPAFRKLSVDMPEDTVFWMSAIDPASVCGLGLDALKDKKAPLLPRRSSGNHLVYHGSSLVLVSLARGKHLTVYPAPDDDNLVQYWAGLRHLITRGFQPLRNITIETINGIPAGKSPYADSFKTVFDVLIDFNRLILYKKM